MFVRSLIGSLLIAGVLGATPSYSRVADAAMEGDHAAVRSLLKQGADVNASQGDGMTALHWAAYHDDLETMRLLLGKTAKADATTRVGAITPLILAAANGSAIAVQALLAAGAQPNLGNANGTTALMVAAAAGDPETLKVLIQHGAKVNATETAHGQTALMFAAALNRVDAIQVLLANGADAKIATKPRAVERVRVDADGHVYYDWPSPEALKAKELSAEKLKAATAAAQSQLDAFARAIGLKSAQFVPYKPPPRLEDMPLPIGADFAGGMTALLFAAREGHTEAAKALLTKGADINQASADKVSPLVIAITNGHLDLARYLLEHGADPNVPSRIGLTALYATIDVQWAPHASYPQPTTAQEDTNYLDLMKELIAHGAKVNAPIYKRLWFRSFFSDSTWAFPTAATPFWRAAQSSDINAMRLLVEHGADPKLATKGGVTPLMVASGVGWGANWSVNAPVPPIEAVKYCVELGNDVNAVDNRGYSALHGAAYIGNNEIVTYLAAKGAKADTKTNTGASTADMANGPNRFAQPHPETVALLEKLGSSNSHNCRSDQCVVDTAATAKVRPLSSDAIAAKDALNRIATAIGLSTAVYLPEASQ